MGSKFCANVSSNTKQPLAPKKTAMFHRGGWLGTTHTPPEQEDEQTETENMKLKAATHYYIAKICEEEGRELHHMSSSPPGPRHGGGVVVVVVSVYSSPKPLPLPPQGSGWA